MSTHDTIVDRLSDYLDGELDDAARLEVESHLKGCTACRETLEELRVIATTAAQLPTTVPDHDPWEGIAARIGVQADARVVPFARIMRRTFSFTLPQLAAAGIALMVLSGAMVYVARSGDSRADFPIMSADNGRARAAALPVSLSDPQYDGAIADLEQALEAGRSKLDPETVKVLEQNLAAIDEAIEQCRRALETDPANEYLSSHLVSARQRKLALLRKAAALTAG
jgi:anti-sigma factor RsiW